MDGFDPGRLRHRLVLEAAVDVMDDIGGAARSWTIVATLWAEIMPASSEDRFLASRREQAITHQILIRYRPDVMAAMRLRADTRLFNIHRVVDREERRRFLTCYCEEIAA
jgi:SPP1 family predicted phage head-tail adaptor